MLYWMILDSGRKLQFVGIWWDHFKDFIGAESAVIYFAARALRSDIMGVELHFVAYFEGQYRLTLAVSIFLLAVLGTEDLCL